MNRVSYDNLKFLVFAFLAFYLSIGIGARFLSTQEEDFYPFFSWFLFSHVPQRIQSDFAVTILEVNGETFKTPIPLENASSIYGTSRSFAQYNQYIRSLGTAIKQNNTEEIERLRQLLEYGLPVKSMTYEVQELTFNPIEKFKSGAVIEKRILGKFVFEKY
jgi:hypothetical protein